MALRFGNALEPLWRRESIANIQITLAERLARARVAASTTAPAPCATWCKPRAAAAFDHDGDGAAQQRRRCHPRREAQGAALACPSRPNRHGAMWCAASTVPAMSRARVPGYLDEVKVPAGSHSKPLSPAHRDRELALGGVPFYLRTGKRWPSVTRRSSSTSATPHSIFPGTLPPQPPVINLQPEDGLELQLMARTRARARRARWRPFTGP